MPGVAEVVGGPDGGGAISRATTERPLACLRTVPVQVVVALAPGVHLGVVIPRADGAVPDGNGAGAGRCHICTACDTKIVLIKGTSYVTCTACHTKIMFE